MKEEFPIISVDVRSLFVGTNNDNFIGLSRTISAIKTVIGEGIKQRQENYQ